MKASVSMSIEARNDHQTSTLTASDNVLFCQMCFEKPKLLRQGRFVSPPTKSLTKQSNNLTDFGGAARFPKSLYRRSP